MSKAMLVTMPCVLLLLDYWPLPVELSTSTFDFNIWRLVMEKIPFFVAGGGGERRDLRGAEAGRRGDDG